MVESVTRVVDGVKESLCWCFRVHGKSETTLYEIASGHMGPLDRDRKRRLRRGETFQRLDRSGCPREYTGLVWRPAACDPPSELLADAPPDLTEAAQ